MGAKYIANYLSSNRTLTRLNLLGNDLRSGADKIKESLKNNLSLTECQIIRININSSTYSSIEEQIAKNKALAHKLFVLIKDGDQGSIEGLVRNGVSPNASDDDRNTTLHQAVKYCQVKLVRFFRDHNVSRHKKNSKKATALDIAQREKFTEAIPLLS